MDCCPSIVQLTIQPLFMHIILHVMQFCVIEEKATTNIWDQIHVGTALISDVRKKKSFLHALQLYLLNNISISIVSVIWPQLPSDACCMCWPKWCAPPGMLCILKFWNEHFRHSCSLSIVLVVVFVIFKQVFLLCKFCEYMKIWIKMRNCCFLFVCLSSRYLNITVIKTKWPWPKAPPK